MKITKIEPFILHAPVTSGRIADSTHNLTHWGAPGVAIHSDTGHIGYGFTGTHAHLATDKLITDCISDSFGPLLIGEDPREVRGLWEKLYRTAEIYWVGRAGITHLALSAIDVALWDLKAKIADQPLWQLLGGSSRKIKAYNTNGGWLNFPIDKVVDDCLRMVEVEGFKAVKLKVGGADTSEDIRRVAAVRKALGDSIEIMTDANGKWTLPQAVNACHRLAEHAVTWIEEPIAFDDVEGHKRLADASPVPIALGEQLYMVEQFRDFIKAGAVHYVQADAVRLAGVTEWWQVADLSLCNRLPVVPHVGDMCQLHIQLCIAHSACNLLEYIPWLKDWMKYPAKVEAGFYIPPTEAGAGTEPTEEALKTINRLA